MFLTWLEPGDDFPDPRQIADSEGLVAVGTDLESPRLLRAYELGAFPWFEEGGPVLWWSPDPRCVFTPDALHVSERLERRLRRELPRPGAAGPHGLRLSWNEAFDEVMAACGEREEGSWIFPRMQQAYGGLARSGHAHSLEVWRGERLVGGLYGVQRGALFAAESMFHRETDMSKVALVSAVRSVFRAGVRLFDAQNPTPHLSSMGSVHLPRPVYLDCLREVVGLDVSLDGLVPDWRPVESV